MGKKKEYKWITLVLCILEFGIGVSVFWIFIKPAVAEKRILHPIEYLTVVNVEERGVESESSEKELPEEEKKEEVKIDFSKVTCEVSHDLSLIKGSRINIASAEESSVIKQEGHSNTAYEAYDGDLSTSWQEGVSGSGIGSWLYYTFTKTRRIENIVLYVGVWREAEGKDYYHDNYRPKEIEIAIGEWKWNVKFDDNQLPQVVHFSTPVPAKDLKFTILDVYKTNRYEDTGIAEIAAYTVG